MQDATRQKIIELATVSLRELGDHAFQDQVISSQIKCVRTYLDSIVSLCQEGQSTVLNAPQRSRLDDTNKTKILLIVYAMARFDFPILNRILDTSYNQSEAFNYLEKLTGVKSTTLKNMRDRFDPYVVQERSNRKGWHQVQLMPEYATIKDKFDCLDETAMAKELTGIFDSFQKL